MDQYLRATSIIDWTHPAVRALAQQLAEGEHTPLTIAQRCFEWVRDEIRHSCDYQLNPVTCAASDVLAAGTGFCYAKSHLLVALCRANGIPAGLCYQRLCCDDQGTTYCLHGLAALNLPPMAGIGSTRAAIAPASTPNSPRRSSSWRSRSSWRARPTCVRSTPIPCRSW